MIVVPALLQPVISARPRLWALALVLAFCALPLAATAQNVVPPQDGREYETLDSISCLAPNAKTVEIVKVHSYSCVHCFRMAELLEDWEETLPDTVSFMQMPVLWGTGGGQEHLAKLFWGLKLIGVDDEATQLKIYSQIHDRRRRFGSDADIAKIVERVNLDPQKVARSSRSFLVRSQIRRSKALTKAWGINGTPSLVVAGKYRIAASRTNNMTQKRMLEVAKWLAEKEVEDGNIGACRRAEKNK